mgnify:CR=1 FL=1
MREFVYHGASGIYNDSFIAEYRRLADAAHEKGGKIAAQLVYRSTEGENSDCKLWGMSAVTHKTTGLTPHEMAEVRKTASVCLRRPMKRYGKLSVKIIPYW